MSEYFEHVERELRAAVRHHAHRPWHARLRQRRRRRGLGIVRVGAGRVATAVAVVLALTVAVGAILLAHHTTPGAPAGQSTPPAIQKLVSQLAVLRSPQTPAARRWLHGRDARRLTLTTARFGLLAGLVRVVSLPEHERLVLYVVSRSRLGMTGLGYMERGGSSGFGACCITAGEFSHPVGPGPWDSQSGRIPPQVYFEIVPDGVSRVRWTFARRGKFPPPGPGARRWEQRTGRRIAPSVIGAPNSAPLTVTVVVKNNVAARRLPNRGAAVSDTWLSATGRVIAHRGKH